MAILLQFTGLSGAGKTTLANALCKDLNQPGFKVKIIDGDVYRQTLCKDLGFSKADRIENIQRLGKLAGTLSAEYDLIIIAAINPFEASRRFLKKHYKAKLIFIDCHLNILKNRDTKGLYKLADLPDGDVNKVYNLTGVNAVFEYPKNADLILNTGNLSKDESIFLLKNFIATL